ncbi:SDR family NAD(P)-dependent oxidoreductase [Mycobacterium sp.]|uniref:SDR family NAD(P)-dependent oxidoreductase n=1 Tax=Mycobacterium sp. TaxID=1785 RepID=UPI003BAB9665
MTLPSPTRRNCAVITGASSGIGEALAEGLARRGYSLILVARRANRLQKLADRLGDEHGVCTEIRGCDLVDRGARAELTDDLATRDVAILCNNAGFATYGNLARLNQQQEISEVELNCVAVHQLTLAVLPAMVERKGGAILITGSTAGNQPGPGNTTYAATKAFANTFAESLHTELSGTGVTCTLLAPGPVRTEFGQVAGLANLERLLPNPLWVSAPQAADAAIAAMAKGKRRVAPGAFAKAQTLGGQYTPRAIIGPLLHKVYGKVT